MASVTELKEKGNVFVREKRYQEATECYTAALSLDPVNHAVLSNRSLTFYRQGKLDEALNDANECIKVAPDFAKGYLRKATVLNGLALYVEAMAAAEEGYKRRQNDFVCKECISQWLQANQGIFKPVTEQINDSDKLPSSFLILSKEMYEIYQKVTLCRVSAAGMTQKLMISNLLNSTKELDHVLEMFGHKVPFSMLNWIHTLSLTTTIDPQTDFILNEIVDQITQSGTEFSIALMNDIDPILHPVLCPFIVLCVMIVNGRSYTLDCMNFGHHERQVICKSLLPLFHTGVLRGDSYIVHHLCTLVGLVGSFRARRIVFQPDNSEQLKVYSNEMKEVLSKFEPKVWEYHELRKICLDTLALTEQETKMLKQKRDVHITTAGVAEEAKKQFEGHSPTNIASMVKQYLDQTKAKNPELITIDDIEYLLYGSYALADLGQEELAVAAFEGGQYYFIRLFMIQMASGAWSLDEMGSIITGPRNIILEVAAKLAVFNSELFINTIIRWKSLYTEFNALLIRIGLRNTYTKTYAEISKLQKEGVLMDERAILEVITKHKDEENKLVQNYGPTTLEVIFRHCYQPIQQLIEKDEVVLDYCYLCTHENATENEVKSEILCGIVVIKPEGKPLCCISDFSDFTSLVNLWQDHLSNSDGKGFSDKASHVSTQLCNILFPPKVRRIIEDKGVRRVFLCPDLSMTIVPLDLIQFPDNEMLYQKCSVTLLSSSREILRGGSGALLEENLAHKGFSPMVNSHVDTIDPKTGSSNNRCIIFANPNFNLKSLEKTTLSLAHIVDRMFGLFHINRPMVNVEPLPSSEEEANQIELILSANKMLHLEVEKITGDGATVKAALQMQSPFVLHFATHTFSAESKSKNQLYGGNFWASAKSGLVLAGASTFLSGNYNEVLECAGSGQLTALAICTMTLSNTRLVYLSACSSSSGRAISGESPITLAHAFHASGAHTVIGTLWPVSDKASSKFSSMFYSSLCNPGVHPSEALVAAKMLMQQDAEFNHWFHWAPYICLGCDFPLFISEPSLYKS